MEKYRSLLGDVATFGVIALVAALFGFSHANHDVTLIGRVVCGGALAWMTLSFAANRPSAS